MFGMGTGVTRLREPSEDLKLNSSYCLTRFARAAFFLFQASLSLSPASASRKECALLKKLLHISARHCPDWSSPVGQLRNERFMAIEEPAFMPKNLPASPSSPVEGQLFPLSTRSSNSK